MITKYIHLLYKQCKKDNQNNKVGEGESSYAANLLEWGM